MARRRKVRLALLPARAGEGLHGRLAEPLVGVRDQQLHALEAPAFQGREKALPGHLRLAAPIKEPQHLPLPFLVDAHRPQEGPAHYPLALPDLVEPGIHEEVAIPPQGPSIEGLDRRIQVLQQLGDQAGAHRGPEGLLGEPGHFPVRNAHQDHVHAGGHHRPLRPLPTLEDRRFEGTVPRLGHRQVQGAGHRLEAAGLEPVPVAIGPLDPLSHSRGH